MRTTGVLIICECKYSITAQPKPLCKTWSSIVQTTSTLRAMNSRVPVSIGLIQRGLISATEIPFSSSLRAASSATSNMLPSPKIATSRPCCTTSALPISRSRSCAAWARRGNLRAGQHEDCHVAPMLHNFRFADFEKPRFRFDFCACSRSSWIADGDRTGVVMRHCPEHIDKFIFVLRLHVHPIRDVPQVTDVEQAMVRRAVVAA